MTGASHETLRVPSLEGADGFDVRWPAEHRALPPGLTAVLRVKNESRSLPWVLPPLFRAAQHVVVVDNQSDDGTAEVARQAASQEGALDRLTVETYPFAVSRCGPEHLATPARSVHSLVHFNNWSFSHVRTAYSMKWDGDMVLTEEGVDTIADLSWQLQTVEAVVAMPFHPLFVESDRVAYLDVGLWNLERYVYPMAARYRFAKAYEWEIRLVPEEFTEMRLPEGLCVELKYLDEDEFSHWTSPEAFADSRRTARKRREWGVFNALARGDAGSVNGIQRIESPPGVHVVDHVTGTWLPQAKRPLVDPDLLLDDSG